MAKKNENRSLVSLKCSECKEGELLERNNCVSSCSSNKLYADITNKKCVKCTSTTFKYKGNDNPCISPQPTGTLVVDTDYNIIEDLDFDTSVIDIVRFDSFDGEEYAYDKDNNRYEVVEI